MPGLLNPFAYGSGTPPATLLSVMQARSPYGLWMSGEASGTTLADQSGNSRNMTITGSPTAYQVGGAGASVVGVSWPASTAVSASAASATTVAAGSFTIVSWVYFSTVPTGTLNCLAVDNATAGARVTVENTGQGRFSVANSGTTSCSTGLSALAANTWHLLAGVCNAGTLRLRWDGANTTTASKTPAMSGRTPKIHSSAATGAFAGVVGPSAYYESALTDADIDAILAAGL